jgi:hypothetical protein
MDRQSILQANMRRLKYMITFIGIFAGLTEPSTIRPSPLHSFTMLVIVRANDWRLIDCRQDVKAAWRLAHALAWKTGVCHWVGRI